VQKLGYDFIEKLRNLECPFCNNGKKFVSPSGLISHVTRYHRFDACPLCNYEGNLIHHFSKMSDIEHQVLWAIYTTFGNRKRSKKLLEIRDSLWGWLQNI